MERYRIVRCLVYQAPKEEKLASLKLLQDAEIVIRDGKVIKNRYGAITK